jgi:hypothetical protein
MAWPPGVLLEALLVHAHEWRGFRSGLRDGEAVGLLGVHFAQTLLPVLSSTVSTRRVPLRHIAQDLAGQGTKCVR